MRTNQNRAEDIPEKIIMTVSVVKVLDLQWEDYISCYLSPFGLL